MKIVIAVNHFYPSQGGCEYVCKHLADYWSKNHDVWIVTRAIKDRKNSDFKYNIVEYNLNSAADFNKKIDHINPDIVLVYSDVFDYFRTITTIKHKYKLIVALCGANWIHKNPSFANTFYRSSLSNIQTIICHSIYERDYKFYTNKNLISKTTIIPNGVDLSEFDENKISKEQIVSDLSLSADFMNYCWVLNVSNFFPGKGQNYLIDILNRVKTKNISYIQVSSDPKFTSVNEVLELEWSKIKKSFPTVLLKNIPRKYVVALFKQSNAFAFTSVKEVAPIVLLESMAANCPWVACDVGNAQELKGGICIKSAKDSAFQAIFDSRIKDSFAEGIDKVLEQPIISSFGRNQIESRFNWDAILPQYDSVLND